MFNVKMKMTTMEKKAMTKKRIRPSLTQVRELERKLAEQTEALHDRCQEADGWRERYRNLLFEKRMLEKDMKDLKAINSHNRSLANTLDVKNQTLRRENKLLDGARVLLVKENKRLLNRNWWQRLWNMY